VRDVFRLAKENSPAIIFIDEVRGAARGWRPPCRAALRHRSPLAAGRPAAGNRRHQLAASSASTSCLPLLTAAAAPQVDAIATSRFDAQTGADREVQRILMELLNQMDGFDQTVNVKVRSLLGAGQLGGAGRGGPGLAWRAGPGWAGLGSPGPGSPGLGSPRLI
jgi:SpoVK/Ycf46/Vps4 family AAA+-type ATPase